MEKANVRQRIQMKALRYLLKKEKHASTITSEVSDYDTYWMYFTPKDQSSEGEEGQISEGPEPLKMLVEPEADKPLRARRVRKHGEGKQKPKAVTPAMLKGAKFEIRHFHRETETTYTSPITAAVIRCTRIFWLFWLWHQILKIHASRKTKFLRERKSVLQAIMELDDEGWKDISYLSVAEKLRGPNVFLLPKDLKARYFRHNRRIIDSLASTGELKYDSTRKSFVLTGKCMASLLEWERELRIHRAHVLRECVIIFFTLVIAAGTAVQAYQAINGNAP